MVDWRRLSRRLGFSVKLRDPPNLPAYGWSYFDHLIAVYVALDVPNAHANEVIKKARERADDLNWGDIFLLENIVFTLQPPEVLQRTAWILRERLRQISSPAFYENYVASRFPTDADAQQKPLLFKADLTRLLDLLHWYYSLIPIRESIRKSLTEKCIWIVLLYTFVLGGILAWCRHADASYLATLVSVIYCGIIGGFVSSQRRMQNIPTDSDPLLSVFGLDNAGYYLWLSPLLGAIFAVVLMAMFVGGVLKGTAFPAFHVTTPQGTLQFFRFAWETLPVTSEDYGKLCVWAFLAGFAERLVPDSLDRLGGKLSEKQTASGPPPPPPPPPPPGGGGGAPKVVVPPKSEAVTQETVQDALHSGEAPEVTEDEPEK